MEQAFIEGLNSKIETLISMYEACKAENTRLEAELESWAWSPVLALPKHHIPREQDWGGGAGDKVLLGSRPVPATLFPTSGRPILTLQVDSQGFRVGWSGVQARAPEGLCPPTLPLAPTRHYKRSSPHTPTPGKEGRGLG